MPVVVKAIDRVVAGLTVRLTAAAIVPELVVTDDDVLVVYPVADPVRV